MEENQQLEKISLKEVSDETRKGKAFVFIMPYGYAKCWCRTKGNISIIEFDLFPSWNLSPKVGEVLENEHKKYMDNNYVPKDYKKIGHVKYAGASLRFSVLKKDAEEWFEKVYSIINDKKNLVSP
jgi:hypothetical protein